MVFNEFHDMTSPHRSATELRKVPPYSILRLSVVATLLILVLVSATYAMLFVSYQDSLRQQKTNLRNLSIAFAAQTLSVAQTVNQVMLQAQNVYTNVGLREPSLGYIFDEKGPSQEYLLGVHIFDIAGGLIASRGPANTSAPASRFIGKVRTPVLGEHDGPQITMTNIDPVSGRGVINFARAMVDSTGKRTGAVLAQVDSQWFERIYTSVELGKGGSVTLFHRNGTMLVRGPSHPSVVGKSFATTPLFTQYLPVAERGWIEAKSPLDGQQRLYGYDSVGVFPLVIITGMNKADALAAWYGRLWTAVIFLGLISLAVIFLAWRIAKDAKRQSNFIQQLASSEARTEKSFDYLVTIMNAVGTPIWVLDSARRFVMLNDAFSRFVGRSAATIIGRPEKEVLDPQSHEDRERRYQEVLDKASTNEAVMEIRDSTGETRTVIQLTSKLANEQGDAQLVSVLTDFTERQRAEERLVYLANFDTLTGLPNQNRFARTLEAEVTAAATRNSCLGILIVSLERAYEIADLLGHEAGDRALKKIGEVFGALLPRAAGVARIKGAEFALVIRADEGRLAVESFAAELHARLSGPLTLSGRDFYLGPVMGVAIFPQDGMTADELYRNAQSARNRGSAEIGETIHFFSPSAHTDLDKRLTMEAQLRRALERQEFRLVCQPKVNIADGRIVGFEALLRWSNSLLGEVSPVEFIPIAEHTGLIIPIGAWALEEACRLLQALTVQAGEPVKVAVNLSPRQVYQKDLVSLIQRCIERYGVQSGSLELEITETALMSREQEVDVLMHEIRALGVELSIDDFGTGYSSLAHLKRFPVQRLKVDRAFIRDLGRDEDSAAIVLSILNLARGLKLKVVAEGVETAEQLAMLRAMACDEYQGFLFSRPVDEATMMSMIKQNMHRPT